MLLKISWWHQNVIHSHHGCKTVFCISREKNPENIEFEVAFLTREDYFTDCFFENYNFAHSFSLIAKLELLIQPGALKGENSQSAMFIPLTDVFWVKKCVNFIPKPVNGTRFMLFFRMWFCFYNHKFHLYTTTPDPIALRVLVTYWKLKKLL